jgi:hypothetical protein
MIPGDGLAPLLGIEPRRDRGRSDQVAEQNRQMTPLAVTVASALQRLVICPDVLTGIVCDLSGG